MGILIFGTGGGGGGNTIDLSDDLVTPQQVRNPYTFHDAQGHAQIGEILDWNGSVISGASSDANKQQINADTGVRHIKAGSYLARDIELKAMPAGSTQMTQSGSNVYLDKTAGYIAGGRDTLNLPAGSIESAISGTNVNITKHAGYISDGTESVSIPLEYGTRNVTTNGTHTFTPTSGNVGIGSVSVYVNVSSGSSVSHPNPEISSLSNSSYQLKIKHTQSSGNVSGGTTYATYDLRNYSPYLAADYIRSGYTIFGVTGNYSGGSSGSVYFGGASSMALSGQTVTINGSGTLEMVSLIGSSTNTNAIVAVTAWRDSTTCYFYVNNSNGRGTGTASWSNNSVTLNLTNSQSWYFTGSYRVVYAYLA